MRQRDKHTLHNSIGERRLRREGSWFGIWVSGLAWVTVLLPEALVGKVLSGKATIHKDP